MLDNFEPQPKVTTCLLSLPHKVKFVPQGGIASQVAAYFAQWKNIHIPYAALSHKFSGFNMNVSLQGFANTLISQFISMRTINFIYVSQVFMYREREQYIFKQRFMCILYIHICHCPQGAYNLRQPCHMQTHTRANLERS